MHKITLLGSGFIGMFYTRALHGRRGTDRIHTVYSRTEERAQKFAGEWDIPHWTNDLDEAINDPDTDAYLSIEGNCRDAIYHVSNMV